MKLLKKLSDWIEGGAAYLSRRWDEEQRAYAVCSTPDPAETLNRTLANRTIVNLALELIGVVYGRNLYGEDNQVDFSACAALLDKLEQADPLGANAFRAVMSVHGLGKR